MVTQYCTDNISRSNYTVIYSYSISAYSILCMMSAVTQDQDKNINAPVCMPIGVNALLEYH